MYCPESIRMQFIRMKQCQREGENPQEIIKTTACVCMQLQDMLMHSIIKMKKKKKCHIKIYTYI